MADNNIQIDLKWRIERIYVKKVNVELINAPEMFEKTWKPKVNLNFNAKHNAIGENRSEVSLSLDLSCDNHDELTFEMSVELAALVILKNGLSEREIHHILAQEATNTLFAYLRETVDSLAVRASLPPFALAHMDFGKLVKDSLDRLDEEKKKGIRTTPSSNTDELLN